MGRITVFANPDKEFQELAGEKWCVFSGGNIRVYQGDSMIWKKEAEPWDGFEVIDTPEGVYVTEITPPQKEGSLILWLMGLGKHKRVYDGDEYEDILAEARKKCKKHYTETEIVTDHVMVMQFVFEDRTKNIVGLVDGELTKEEILLLAPHMVYPAGYTKKVLNRFGITPEEFESALQEE